MLRCRHVVSRERCFSFHYEDLVARPAATVTALVEFLGYRFEPDMLNYGQFEHADHKLDLWSDKRHVTSVNRGVLQQESRPSWLDDRELLAAYKAQPAIRALNEGLGYCSVPTDDGVASPNSLALA